LYVAPRLIAAPAGFYIVVTLADPHASYFDESTLTTRRNVTLTYNDTIRGDAGASTGMIAVWDLRADRARDGQYRAQDGTQPVKARVGRHQPPAEPAQAVQQTARPAIPLDRSLRPQDGFHTYSPAATQA
jgi:hypothetical protein